VLQWRRNVTSFHVKSTSKFISWDKFKWHQSGVMSISGEQMQKKYLCKILHLPSAASLANLWFSAAAIAFL
jgi:hypothetical protein